jgi:hypothetical protein
VGVRVEAATIEALMASDAVMRAPPAVRAWLLELLTAGEGATATTKTLTSQPGPPIRLIRETE